MEREIASRRIFWELLNADSIDNLYDDIASKCRCDTRTVKHVVDDLKRNEVLFCIPNLKKLGACFSMIFFKGIRPSMQHRIMELLGHYVFIDGWTLLPTPERFVVLITPYSILKKILKMNIDEDIIMPIECGALEETPSIYFINMFRRRILLEFCRNPLVRMRELSKILKEPFSTVRYIVRKGFEEGVLDFRRKMMRFSSLMSVVQVLVRNAEESLKSVKSVTYPLAKFHFYESIESLDVVFTPAENLPRVQMLRDKVIVNYKVYVDRMYWILLSHRF